ncbi:hypothetical protein J5N97_000292 [Dioscorea zingiberensis]|uniref:Uncharacterized protein n=1 Tax=Dioscorea zingiberensis TaxID=325984 RepID=A0A9D5BSL4_9LILI|nr:hypothetical protein J5N97_000292 [Dioscorea zingiberensis]
MDEEAKHEVDVPPSEVVDGDVANDWSKEDDGVAPEAPPTAAESLDPPLILMKRFLDEPNGDRALLSPPHCRILILHRRPHHHFPGSLPPSPPKGDSSDSCLSVLAVVKLIFGFPFIIVLHRGYLIARKHEDTPEAYPLPTEVVIVKVAAGWAQCIAVTAFGEVYTWGWKECVPYGMITGDKITEVSPDNDENDGNSSSRREG